MFQYPRACCVCHESYPNVLTNCRSCGSSSFCKDHVSDSSHKSHCPKYVACYSFDLLRNYISGMTLGEAIRLLLGFEAMYFIPHSKQIIKPPVSMRHFLDTYFKKIVDARRKNSRPEFWDMLISEYFSRCLTLISAMKMMEFKPKTNFTVHILGSNHMELEVNDWETFLHWFPQVQKLKIILIGPELRKNYLRPHLCYRCISDKRSFIVETHDDLYHHYLAKEYSKPNLIIGYNIGISECENPGSLDDTWKPTILCLPKVDVPFIFTAYSKKEAQRDHERMCLFLGARTNHFWFGENQFASLRPVREFEVEGVFYQNNYLVIYNYSTKRSEKVEEKKINSVKAELKELKLKEENDRLREEMKRLQTAIEQVKQGEKLAPERRELVKEVENIEETIKKEIRELKEEIKNLKVQKN